VKILITGAAGMLANDVISEIENSGSKVFGSTIKMIKTDVNLRVSDIQKVDVSVFREVDNSIKYEKPDIIFHFAAETNVDLCEQKPEYAYKINYIGTENIALTCQKYNIPLLYISTGAVFNGNSCEPYSEIDIPEPNNVYGKSKYYGEIVIKNLLKKFFILRAGWMIGGWGIDKKFVYKIVKQLKEGRKEIFAVNDKFGSPTFTKDFAKNLLPLLKTERYGLYHMVNKGGVSRFDIALKIVEFMKIKSEVKVIAVNSAEFPLPAPRPRSEMMRNHHLELIGMNNMACWEDALRRYIVENVEEL